MKPLRILAAGALLSALPLLAADTYTIAVIPKGSTHEHWKTVHAGAVKAQRELEAKGVKVEVMWQAPLREDDRDYQIRVVENLIARKVSGICIAPLDSKALVPPINTAARAGIPVIVFDSAVKSDKPISYIATDNYKGGRLAADRLGELMGGKGKALLLRYQEGSASTEERERGFLDEMKAKYPGVTVLPSDQYAGATRDTAKTASENLLNRFGDDLQGIFTPNESSTAGMLLALQDINKAGKIIFVGFDSSETFINAMNARQLHGFVVQNPFHMGYLGVRTMVEHLQGKPVEKVVDTGVQIITPDNLNTAETQALLKPPINDYLQ